MSFAEEGPGPKDEVPAAQTTAETSPETSPETTAETSPEGERVAEPPPPETKAEEPRSKREPAPGQSPAPSPEDSQTPTVTGTYEDNFDAGLAFYRTQRFAEASTAFRAAASLEETPQALFAWGQAERYGGDCRQAIQLFDRALAMKLKKKQARVIREARRDCEQVIAQAERVVRNARTIAEEQRKKAARAKARAAAAKQQADEAARSAISGSVTDEERAVAAETLRKADEAQKAAEAAQRRAEKAAAELAEAQRKAELENSGGPNADIAKLLAEMRRAPDRWYHDPVGGTMVVVGAASLVASGVFYLSGRTAANDAREGNYAEFVERRQSAEDRFAAARWTGIAGGALVAAGAGWYLYKWANQEDSEDESSVTASIGRDAIVVGYSVRY